MRLCADNLVFERIYPIGLLLTLGLLLFGCAEQLKQQQHGSDICGQGVAPPALEGLFWLVGEPVTANVVCSVQAGEYKTVQVLAPESRDPILLNDRETKQKLLVERFSGSAARPSRATWFAPSGDILVQRGDWPQNVYSVLRVSDSRAIVTGFDFADLRPFTWSSKQGESLGLGEPPLLQISQVNPILTLQRGEWMATLDGGFDLQRYVARTARAVVFGLGASGTYNEALIVDPQQKVECKNAFQFLLLSHYSAVISCNPQYFGAVDGEKIAIFYVELSTQGNIVARALLSRDSIQVQKIDLWGVSPTGDRVLISLKQTQLDDYNGKIVQSGWITWRDSIFTPERSLAGPVVALSSSSLACACQYDSERCRTGDLLLFDEESGTSTSLRTNFSLPFLSFAVDIPQP